MFDSNPSRHEEMFSGLAGLSKVAFYCLRNSNHTATCFLLGLILAEGTRAWVFNQSIQTGKFKLKHISLKAMPQKSQAIDL